MTSVVAALIWDNDRFMICQRPATKSCALLWEFVGGKVEPGETKEQALIRECREELGIIVCELRKKNRRGDVADDLARTNGYQQRVLFQQFTKDILYKRNARHVACEDEKGEKGEQ